MLLVALAAAAWDVRPAELTRAVNAAAVPPAHSHTADPQACPLQTGKVSGIDGVEAQ